MNKKSAILISAELAALVIPIVQTELRKLDAKRSRKRLRELSHAENSKTVYDLDFKEFEKYLDDITSLYETPESAWYNYTQNRKFNRTIRNL